MPSRDQGVPVEVLREAARQRSEATSLRIAAKEIGMSWKGLQAFTAGTNPHPATIRKLTEWHVRRAAVGEVDVSADVVQAALAVLVRHFPPSERDEAAATIAETIRKLTERLRLAEPQWFSQYRP